jgi:fido (protein-threonine AMPylation protein)
MTDGLLISCPEWDGRVADHHVGAASDAVHECYRDVENCARHRIANEESFRRWHRILFQDLVPLHYYAGHFRQHDPDRVCLGQNVGVGNGIDSPIPGMPFQQVTRHMIRLSDQMRAAFSQFEATWPTLQPQDRAKRLALLTAKTLGEFIRIHPFINGNGRVSRVAWLWALLRFDVPAQCRIAPRPNEPYSQLMGHSMRGDDGPLALHILRHLVQNPADRKI